MILWHSLFCSTCLNHSYNTYLFPCRLYYEIRPKYIEFNMKWNVIKVMTWIHKRMGIKTVLPTKMCTDTKCAQRRLLWFPIWRMLDQLNETIKWFGIVGPTHMEPFLIGDWARFQPVREGVTYVRYHWAKFQPKRRRYICNIFRLWMSSCSTIDRKRAKV